MDAVGNDEDKGPVPRAIKDFQRFMCFGLHLHLQHLADAHIHSESIFSLYQEDILTFRLVRSVAGL